MLLLVLLGILAFGYLDAGAPPAGPGPVALPEAALRSPEPQVPTGRFTTATEVRPILAATRASWVAVREYDGQDLVYFTGLVTWRCGLWEVRYGLNGDAPATSLPFEPCHDDSAQPNGMVDLMAFPPFVAAPLGSVESVDVTILYDDGTEDGAVFARASVLVP